MTDSAALSPATSMRDRWTPAQPVAFAGCAGWLHEGASDRAVVLIGATGFDGLCAHQSWRAFAALLADRGVHAVRFDLPGEGDSLGASDTCDISAWRAAIQSAIEWTRRETGAKDIALAGLGLGALLAAETAAKDQAIETVAFLAPPASGKAYIRELKARARMMASERPGCSVSEDGVRLCGYLAPAALVRAIESLPPIVSQNLAGRRMLVLKREEDSETYRDFQMKPFPDFAGMMVGPTASRTPWTVLEQAADWLADGVLTGDQRRSPPAAPALAGDGFSETRVVFGEDGGLAGVLCRPRSSDPDAAAVILPNAGANNHTGWGRMNVDFARSLSGCGVSSLRFDAAGIGDSLCFRSGPRPLLYSARHRSDLQRAVDVMAAEGHARIVLVGACAGGFNAFHVLHDDPRIGHAIAVNMLRMLWSEHDDLDTAEAEIQQRTAAYVSKARDSRQWIRLLKGEIGLKKLGAAAISLISKTIRPKKVDIDSHKVIAMMQAIAAAGKRIDFVYGENDAGRDEFARCLGEETTLSTRYSGAAVTLIADCDHEITPEPARATLLAMILKAARDRSAGLTL